MTDEDKLLEPNYEAKRSYVVKGELLNAIARALRLLRVVPGPGLTESTGPLGRVLSVTGADPRYGRYAVYREGGSLFVAPGGVSYVEIPTRDNEETPPAIITRPIIPTLGGIALDAETRPFFNLAGRSDGTVWLICQQTLCSGLYATDAAEPERIELTDRDAEPDAGEGEHAIPLCSFDVDNGALVNVKVHLEDDWEQWYRCDGDFDESNDSEWGSDLDSAGSAAPDSAESGSSDEEVPDDDCTVGMRARWINKVTCFPADPDLVGDFGCTPGKYTFIFEVEFFGTDPYGEPCPHWAYGVKMPGASTGEVVWLDSKKKIVQFTWDSAPACDSPVLVWRARGYGPLKDEGGNIIPSCCGRLWNGQVPEFPVKLGPVCDCTCSSSSDLEPPPP